MVDNFLCVGQEKFQELRLLKFCCYLAKLLHDEICDRVERKFPYVCVYCLENRPFLVCRADAHLILELPALLFVLGSAHNLRYLLLLNLMILAQKMALPKIVRDNGEVRKLAEIGWCDAFAGHRLPEIAGDEVDPKCMAWVTVDRCVNDW